MPEASSSQHTNPTEMFIFEVLKEWLCLVDIYPLVSGHTRIASFHGGAPVSACGDQ